MPLFSSGQKSKLESDKSEINVNFLIGLHGAGHGVRASGISRHMLLLVPTEEMNLSGGSRRKYFFDSRELNTLLFYFLPRG